MTLKVRVQQENHLKSDILAKLNHLQELTEFGQLEICRKLGYEKDVLSRVRTEENYIGSPQLLAGISLLIELEELKRKPQEETIEQRFSRLEREIQSLRSGKYPESKPETVMMNEKKTGFKTHVSSKRKAEIHAQLGEVLRGKHPPAAE